MAGIYTVAGLLTITLAAGFILSRSTTPPEVSRPFPPGPPTAPFLGNLHQIPLQKSFIAFADFGRKYCKSANGLLGLQIGSYARILVLNKWQHVRDLLDARGAIYSSRPIVPIVEYVIPPPGDLHLVFMPYGHQWRRARKVMTDFLKDGELPVQDAESTQMMWELAQLDTSDHAGPKGAYEDIAMRYFGAVILDTVFGIRGRSYEPDGYLRRFFAVQNAWTNMLEQGAMPPFDILPFLKHIPDALTPWRGWRKRAEFLKQRQSSLYHELWTATEERVKQGKSPDCFVAGIMRQQEEARAQGRDKDIFTQLELDYLGGFLMEGGADTTAMAFLTFILAMAAHPELQQQAQAEVDSVFGPDELPHTADGEKLPFLKACFLETLRWRPGFPTAIPHATSADDIYQDFFIPKGTTVIMNTWAVQHDPDEYDNPDSFVPARYLANPFGTRYKNDTKIDDPDLARKQTYAFGAGRRICAGSQMAENTMMMIMTKLVWAFDVAPSEGGKLDTNMQTAFKDAILTGPKTFDVEFRIRSDKRRATLEKEWHKADSFLERFE